MLILPHFQVLLAFWWWRFLGSGTAWPYSVDILCTFSSFLKTLHWPVDAGDMGHFGLSYLEVLVLFEHWVGHRLLSEKVTRPHVRANRPILLPSAPVSEGIEILGSE